MPSTSISAGPEAALPLGSLSSPASIWDTKTRDPLACRALRLPATCNPSTTASSADQALPPSRHYLPPWTGSMCAGTFRLGKPTTPRQPPPLNTHHFVPAAFREPYRYHRRGRVAGVNLGKRDHEPCAVLWSRQSANVLPQQPHPQPPPGGDSKKMRQRTLPEMPTFFVRLDILTDLGGGEGRRQCLQNWATRWAW